MFRFSVPDWRVRHQIHVTDVCRNCFQLMSVRAHYAMGKFWIPERAHFICDECEKWFFQLGECDCEEDCMCTYDEMENP